MKVQTYKLYVYLEGKPSPKVFRNLSVTALKRYWKHYLYSPFVSTIDWERDS